MEVKGLGLHHYWIKIETQVQGIGTNSVYDFIKDGYEKGKGII